MEFELIFKFILIILGFFVGLLTAIYYKKETDKPVVLQEKKKDTAMIDILLTEGYFDKVNTLIDSFISAAGDNYTVFALSSNSNHYLNESDQETMTKYIFGNVKRNITPEVKEVISTVYNIDDEEDNENSKLNQLINVRIKLYMINFIRNFNSLPEDLPNMKG